MTMRLHDLNTWLDMTYICSTRHAGRLVQLKNGDFGGPPGRSKN